MECDHLRASAPLEMLIELDVMQAESFFVQEVDDMYKVGISNKTTTKQFNN